jgi:hypothetical protein
MKIFWSWQSDTPGNIGKFLVRDALNDAVEKLKGDNELEAPVEREIPPPAGENAGIRDDAPRLIETPEIAQIQIAPPLKTARRHGAKITGSALQPPKVFPCLRHCRFPQLHR